jgi:hypothetical protein
MGGSKSKPVVLFTLKNTHGKTVSNTKIEWTEQELLMTAVQTGDRVLQLGGNVGTSCIAAGLHTKLAANVCVEPSNHNYAIMRDNVAGHNVTPIHGIISENCKGSLVGRDRGAYVSAEANGQPIGCHTLASVTPPGGFSVLFADCEGCLPGFITEYGAALAAGPLHTIVYERDREKNVDYRLVDDYMRVNGFKCHGGFHRVCRRSHKL